MTDPYLTEPTEYVQQGHLGGYFVGGDPACLYPELWEWLVKVYGVETVLDVGCGDGVALDAFRAHGATAWGVEGVEQNNDWIMTHDFTTGRFWQDIRYDLVWSCEFVEHVEERYVPNFLAAFSMAGTVLMTHADPGQGGHHHVNCRHADYWIGAMAAIGYALDDGLTRDTRALAAANLNPYNHYRRSGLAFTRRPA